MKFKDRSADSAGNGGNKHLVQQNSPPPPPLLPSVVGTKTIFSFISSPPFSQKTSPLLQSWMSTYKNVSNEAESEDFF